MNFTAPLVESKFRVERKHNKDYVPSWEPVRLSNIGPMLRITWGSKVGWLRTPDAWRLAWKLHNAADENIRESNDGVLWKQERSHQFVALWIDETEIHMPCLAARKVAVALWRRSDAVDDFQLANKVRLT